MSKAPQSNLEDKILPKNIHLPEQPITAGPHDKPKEGARVAYDYAYDLRDVPIDEGLAKMAEEFWR